MSKKKKTKRDFSAINAKAILERIERYRIGDLPLLGKPTANRKLAKGLMHGVMSVSLSLAPSDECMEIVVPGYKAKNMCPNASKACRSACIVKTGNYRYDRSKIARIAKTLFWLNHPEEFKALLAMEIRRYIFLAEKQNLVPAIRTNTLSDDTELALWVAITFPKIQAYDYTKNLRYWLDPKNRANKPKNYTVAYSLSESNKKLWDELMLLPGSLGAVVFDCKKHETPKTFEGFEVLDGDEHDALFLRKRPRKRLVIGLAIKGASKEMKQGAIDQGFAQQIGSPLLPIAA